LFLKRFFLEHKYYQSKNDGYWEHMLGTVDLNKDGVIDFKEFAEMMKNN